MDIKNLIGRTIVGIKRKQVIDTDDTGFLEITFLDGLQIVIVAEYGTYTGNSLCEYPTSIEVVEKHLLKDLVDLPPEDMAAKL
jgi:hypothetical protein